MAKNKGKKKRFFEVSIPIIGKETQVQAYDIEELEGKFIKYDLTRMLKGKSLELRLIIHVANDKATAVPIRTTLMPYFIRRVLRKGTNYVEDSFPVDCKDSKLRIKPFLITRKKVSRAVRNALRQKTKEELTLYVKNKSAEKIFEDIVHNKMQRPLSLTLKKIYPLSMCDIRVLEFKGTLTEKKKTKKVAPEKVHEDKIENMTEEVVLEKQ